jgi:hypothetical protein
MRYEGKVPQKECGRMKTDPDLARENFPEFQEIYISI